MPDKKQFEAMDIMDFITGRPPKLISMVEMVEVFYMHIEEVLKYLIEDVKVVIEVPNEDCIYHIEKVSSEEYIVKKSNNEVNVGKKMTGIEFVNWLFKVAPFISLVGHSNK